MEKVRLFCLPYAGGTAMVYSSWKKLLDSNIELIPVELAGRGRRSKEAFYNSVNEAVDDIYRSIEDKLDGTRFAVLGHSMGSVLTYELIYKIRELKNQVPVHAFFSGRYPPHVKKDDIDCHSLPEDKFLDELRKVGGTPEEFFQNKDLLNLFLPIIRADYKIIETYKHQQKPTKLTTDITVFSGLEDDKVTENDLKEWHSVTDGNCEVIQFEGGHFFIFDKKKEISDIINRKLVSC